MSKSQVSPHSGANELALVLDALESISLDELDAGKRLDINFIFHADLFREILHGIIKNYRARDIEGLRSSRYQSLYFETDRLDLCVKHCSGKLNRYKFRFRKYFDSGICFLEYIVCYMLFILDRGTKS